MSMRSMIPVEGIEQRIYFLRGHKVMLDSDLALLYGVSTTRLNEQVRRNAARFPTDFMFQLTSGEFRGLMSQIAISKPGRGGRRKLPLVFTQEGVAMLSGVLSSPRAIQVNVTIMRVFVRLREMISSNRDLARRLDALEKKNNRRFRIVFEAINELMEPPVKPRPQIGFHLRKK